MTELPERPTARIFVVDEADRVLLFRHLRPPAVDPTWIPPGGGVEPGESLVAAAVRELQEETGLTLPESALAGPVATAEGIWHSRNGDFFARHWYFLARVAHFELDTTRFEEHEQVVLTGHYWWSAEELSHTRERIRPLGLGALLPVLLASEAGEISAEPVRLAWASD